MRWQSWLVIGCAAGLLGPQADAQSRNRPPPQYKQWGEPDQAKGLTILETFRSKAIPAPYFLEFTLRTYGKGRPDLRLNGRMYGGLNRNGPVSLLEIDDDGQSTQSSRYLIQNGPVPVVWRSGTATIEPELLVGEALSAPLYQTDVTPFDLQLPYLFWQDFVYEGLTRFRGRPTDVFILYPPLDERDLYPEISGVRLYLDSQFDAMMQAEILDVEMAVAKQINLLEIRKIDDAWMAKTIDVKMPDGNKTRFQITAARMNCDWDGMLFQPDSLSGELPVIPEEDLVRIEAPAPRDLRR